ncbi:ABC transporter substrate-binding protein [Paenarthrobacter aurescens]|uniref:Peptide ABC transporter substrate-binding protein n=1 Tax=Paenarthrobacter aurescens TaxID=43663 RepID=A0A4Y3NEM3_PAEAU|nr:ABC transporter substrate-binding protein [Paenarthrobacter aurescens]UKA50458.1 ABC transporter substrate-binding protein [Arthrobacter sp. FW305-123]MDO6142160.1 ABC transporter substrate-binding protein [Paenarthrobacter aurescens]MDO6146008.1 ABC transporter substrate-binding protein [Paenarthrobacter aurescens]MDO6157252.1 ABC transporter substrate-binding protein [Paenarthrobacter aurescens]MDO6161237.1 ABC transporter substrate-binding protein [Paenarthrobacter aurescens]
MKLGPKAAAAAIVLSASLALTACGGGNAGAGTGSSTGTKTVTALTLGTLRDLTSWDPAQAHVGHALQPYQAAYDSLILREPDGKLSPMLATAWKYNDTNTKLTVDLRTDVTFSDGAKFDAAAAKANMDHFKKANGPQMAQLGSVSDIAVVDADTIDINLSAPEPALEYFLSQAAGLMGSPAALGTDAIKTVPVGSGPYVMDKAASVKDSQTVFNARDGYWNKDLQKFKKLTLKVLLDPTARTNALVSGQIDATLLDPKNGKQAEGAKMKLETNQVDWSGLLLLDRDGTKNPALANVKVRQAINHAFDRKTILDQVMLGQGTPTSQPFGKESGAWSEELENYYSYDPEKAKQLLKDSGFEGKVSIDVPTLPGAETLISVMKQQLADVGITLNPGAAITNTFTSDVAAQKYPALFYNLFQGQPTVAIDQIVSTKALYNPFKTTTPELEAKIAAVRTGGADAGKLAQEVNKYVVEQAWFAPLFRVNQMYYHNDKVNVTPQVQQAVPSIYNYSPAK